MITIILKSDGEKVQSRIQGKSSLKEIMWITDAFCTMMIIALQQAGMPEEDAQCLIASAALSATGFVDSKS